MNKGSVIFAFALGAAAGAIITKKLLKNKYEELVQEEVEAIRALYEKKKDTEEAPKPEKEAKSEAEAEEDRSKTAEEYVEQLKKYNASVRKEDVELQEAHIIDYDDFGTDYDTATLTYYADGILVEEPSGAIKSIKKTIGEESLTHFDDEGEEEAIYVRNDYLELDFEVLRDYRKYSDVSAMYDDDDDMD